MNQFKKVIVFGGTHGNEWTGIYAVNNYQDQIKKDFPNLNLEFIHANPEAFKLNKRFKDEDLNRAFQFLHEDRPHSYENQRARELKKIMSEESCFVLDMHTTTSNMGNTVIITQDHPINFHVASQLVQELPDTRIIYSPDPHKKYLGSQSDYGLMIEVGPVANSVINAEVLEATLKIMKQVMHSLSTLSSLTNKSREVEIYEEVEDIFYPQNEKGELISYIHPTFQGQDFTSVNGKYTPFKSFSGMDEELETTEELFPIFINEAAYYPTKLAFTLCRKKVKNF